MKERERLEHPALLPETRTLLQTIQERTDRVVEIRAEPAIRGHARASYVVSDPDPSRHLILYDPRYASSLDHLIAHECGHIVRFAAAAAAEHLVPVATPLSRNVAAHDLLPEIQRLVALGVSERSIGEALPMWMSGAIAQVSSVPADIRIERWLWESFPGLRSVQTRSLVDQARKAQLVLQPNVKRLTPRLVWEASTAMNFALYKSVSRFSGRTGLLRPYRGTPAERLGEELLAMVDSSPDTGLSGDQELAERWAERLGLRGWFRWQRLDEVPAGVRRMWE